MLKRNQKIWEVIVLKTNGQRFRSTGFTKKEAKKIAKDYEMYPANVVSAIVRERKYL